MKNIMKKFFGLVLGMSHMVFAVEQDARVLASQLIPKDGLSIGKAFKVEKSVFGGSSPMQVGLKSARVPDVLVRIINIKTQKPLIDWVAILANDNIDWIKNPFTGEEILQGITLHKGLKHGSIQFFISPNSSKLSVVIKKHDGKITSKSYNVETGVEYSRGIAQGGLKVLVDK